MKKKIIEKYILFFILPLLLVSCASQHTEFEENPVYISSEAQRKCTHITRMATISSFDMEETQPEYGLVALQNDWIKCEPTAGVLFIEVKENTSIHPRKVVLTIHSKLRPATLEIIQARRQ